MEVKELVKNLNGELWDYGHDFHKFSYTELGTIKSVSLEVSTDNSVMSINLWSSQNDNRKYIEGTKEKEYEPLENTILRNYKKVLDSVDKIYKDLNSK